MSPTIDLWTLVVGAAGGAGVILNTLHLYRQRALVLRIANLEGEVRGLRQALGITPPPPSSPPATAPAGVIPIRGGA